MFCDYVPEVFVAGAVSLADGFFSSLTRIEFISETNCKSRSESFSVDAAWQRSCHLLVARAGI